MRCNYNLKIVYIHLSLSIDKKTNAVHERYALPKDKTNNKNADSFTRFHTISHFFLRFIMRCFSYHLDCNLFDENHFNPKLQIIRIALNSRSDYYDNKFISSSHFN